MSSLGRTQSGRLVEDARPGEHRPLQAALTEPGSCTSLCLELPAPHTFVLLFLFCLPLSSSVRIPLFLALLIATDRLSPLFQAHSFSAYSALVL